MPAEPVKVAESDILRMILINKNTVAMASLDRLVYVAEIEDTTSESFITGFNKQLKYFCFQFMLFEEIGRAHV